MKLDLESIMSSPRMDLEKGWISFRIYLKFLNFEFYHFKIFDSKKLFWFGILDWNDLEDFRLYTCNKIKLDDLKMEHSLRPSITISIKSLLNQQFWKSQDELISKLSLVARFDQELADILRVKKIAFILE